VLKTYIYKYPYFKTRINNNTYVQNINKKTFNKNKNKKINKTKKLYQKRENVLKIHKNKFDKSLKNYKTIK
jgi:hypothetical protein